ncbi:ABC transporter substrate-binding protein [Paenisporosarcina sp. TG-14]|uniref:ABC transporter substrate-binding protein n=1 Tax=Paenisporosarcina sp. TG-14 TaxID=1231057 RepID=UPI0003102AF4|nr:extracellular solute-binding protein [Paenisporosarcina sp. TG-14]
MKTYSIGKIATVLLMSLALMGCTSGSSDSVSVSSDNSTKKISFIHWRGEDTEVFKELITKFESENPNITVDMTVYPSEQYQSTAQTLLRDGSTGDVFAAFPGSQFEVINRAKLFADLTGEPFVDNFNENLILAGQYEDKQLALPLQLVYNQPIYNEGIFDELGLTPPEDWEGFLELCETLKENGYIPIAFPGADIGAGQFMNSMMMNNAPDEDIVEKVENGEAKLTDEWWVKTLEQFKELNDKGYFQKDSIGTNHDGAIALVAQEKAAMLATGSYAMASIKDQNPDLKLNLLAPITVSASEAVWEGIHTTTFMLGVNANSSKQEEAKKFIEFLSNPENATVYANGTGQHLTVNGVEYNSEELKDTAVWMEKNTRFQPRYLFSKPDIMNASTGSIQAVISGTDPQKAAEEAQKIVDQNIN